MEHTVLKEWLAKDRTRGDWLARKLKCSYELVRLMSIGKRGISSARAMQIADAMRIREKSDKLLET